MNTFFRFNIGSHLILTPVRRTLLSLCAIAWGLSACHTAPVKKTVTATSPVTQPTLGSIGDLAALALFQDSSLTKPAQALSNQAILLSPTPPYRWLTLSGQVVWSNDHPKSLQPLQYSFAKPVTQVANLPFSQQGDTNFVWTEINKTTPLNPLRFSPTQYPAQPSILLDQGRQMADHYARTGLNWPQLAFQENNQEYWVEFSDMDLKPTKSMTLTGLIQKPFLTLSSDIQPAPNHSVQYTDFTTPSSKILTRPASIWQLQQAILFPINLNPEFAQISLWSTDQNCTLFQAVTRLNRYLHWGYCQHQLAGPTPFIVNYAISAQHHSLALNVLEVLGDEDRVVTYQLSMINNQPSITLVTPKNNQ